MLYQDEREERLLGPALSADDPCPAHEAGQGHGPIEDQTGVAGAGVSPGVTVPEPEPELEPDSEPDSEPEPEPVAGITAVSIT